MNVNPPAARGLSREQIARRAARELGDAHTVYLGAGLSALVSSFVPPGVHVILPSEKESGGHADIAIVEGTQVSEAGDLAGSLVPGQTVEGLGGAMDLVSSAKRVVVVMGHAADDGTPRIVRACTLPVRRPRVVHRIVTDFAVIDVCPEGLVLKEVAPGISAREVQEKTEPTLKVGPDLAALVV